MATIFLEPGGDSDFGVALWAGVNTAPAVATDFVHGGHIKSIKYRAANADFVKTAVGSCVDAGGRFNCWIYLNVLNTAVATIIANDNSGGTLLYRVRLSAANKLQVWNASAQMGTDGATVTSGVWHRIAFCWTVTSTTVNRFVVFLDGVQTISVTNGTLSATGTSLTSIGNESGESALDMRSSDHYLDNSSALTDPGNIWVTAKRPFSNGTTNGFTTQIGSGGSGYGTGHAPQVNERPLSTTNGWSMVGAGSAITEEYSIESQSAGDINITGSTIVDFMGWLDAKSLAGETASLILAGSTSNISLTSTITIFEKIAGSTTYPAGGTDIGIITTTALTTVSLYECGIAVAYIPAVSATLIGSNLMMMGMG